MLQTLLHPRREKPASDSTESRAAYEIPNVHVSGTQLVVGFAFGHEVSVRLSCQLDESHIQLLSPKLDHLGYSIGYNGVARRTLHLSRRDTAIQEAGRNLVAIVLCDVFMLFEKVLYLGC